MMNPDVIGLIARRGTARLVFRSLRLSKAINKDMRQDTILKKDFHELQEKRPKVLFLLPDKDVREGKGFAYHTWSERKLLKTTAATHGNRGGCYERGLVCFDLVDDTVVFNPTSGRTTRLGLPNFENPLTLEMVTRRSFLASFPDFCSYTVLLVTSAHPYGNEYHTVSLKDRQWKKLECKVPHTPVGNKKSVCIDGGLVYAAYGQGDDAAVPILMKFDTRSQVFTRGPALPFIDVYTDTWGLCVLTVFKGKVCVARKSCPVGSHIFSLHIFEQDQGSGWSELSINALHFRDGLKKPFSISFQGATSGGLFVFSMKQVFKRHEAETYIVYYDERTSSFNRVLIEGVHDIEESTVWNHVENITLESIGGEQ